MLLWTISIGDDAVANELEGNVAHEWPTLLRPSSEHLHTTSGQFGLSIGASGVDHILIGAPLQDVSQSPASGALYVCPLQSLRINNTNSTDPIVCREFEASELNDFRQETNFFGASIASNDKHSAVCAPAKFNDALKVEKYPNGQCWVLPVRDVEASQTNQSRPHSSMARLVPFADATRQVYHTSYYYSHAMAGFSAQFSPSSHMLLLGAPGFHEWTGGLLQYNLPNDLSTFNASPPPSSARLYFYRDPAITSYIYFGFAIGSGQFFADQQTYAVAGAPRTRQTGAVRVRFPTNGLS
jgi:hypothetical protein